MNLIERAKNIIIKPKDEWSVISQETTTVTGVVTGYLLILALIPAIAVFVKQGLIGYNIPFFGHVPGTISIGVRGAIISYITYVGGAFLSAFIIDILASSFSSQKNYTKAMQLVVYAYTPMLIAGIFQMIPYLGFLGLVGLYGLYILYLGIKPMMQTPDDKVTTYFIVSLLITIAVYFILSLILTAIIMAGSVAAAAGSLPNPY